MSDFLKVARMHGQAQHEYQQRQRDELLEELQERERAMQVAARDLTEVLETMETAFADPRPPSDAECLRLYRKSLQEELRESEQAVGVAHSAWEMAKAHALDAEGCIEAAKMAVDEARKELDAFDSFMAEEAP